MGVVLADRYHIYKYTGAAAVAQAIRPGGGEFRLAGFALHASGAIAAESITFTTDDIDGAVYDTEIESVDLTGLTDKVYMIPSDERIPIKQKSELDVAWANGNTVTYGLKVFIEQE